MKRIIITFIVMGMTTGCAWTPGLQTNLFSDVWDDHTSGISWFRSSNTLRGEVKFSFAEWANDFEKKQSNLLRIEPTKEYTILSQEDALEDEKLFFRRVTVVSAKTIQKNMDDYKNDFFRIVAEGGVVVEEGSFLRGWDILEKDDQDEYKYEEKKQFVLVNSAGVLQKFGTLSRENLKKHKNEIFVSGELQGSAIISGINLSQTVQQYSAVLQQLQTIDALQKEITKLILNVCTKQKSIVPCF